MAWRAKLGPDMIYIGVEQVDSIGTNDIEVPQDCDLKKGGYRWDKDQRTFVPIHLMPRDALEVPNVLRALAMTIKSLRDGKPLPQEALNLLDWYEKRFDVKL